jgi:heptosyltransferase-1
LTTLIDANFLIVWGNQKERILANEIKEISDKVIICNQLPLDHLMLLVSKVDLVIGPDTGPTHMAWAMNIPSITLFGPTPGYRNTYETMKNRVIESDSNVNPTKLDKNDLSINNIEVKEILKIFKELI